ncbi:hypothetical protein [Roseovarius sp. D0-M9]|uniref:hypothetical protein n=1 Tax=Roseovarius sp. D0-M9 TaxID=3127117 RepID=UPI00300FB428
MMAHKRRTGSTYEWPGKKGQVTLNTELDYKARIFSFADPAAFIAYLKEIDEGTDPMVRHFAEMLYR